MNRRIRGCSAIYMALARQEGQAPVTLDQQQFERAVALVTTQRP